MKPFGYYDEKDCMFTYPDFYVGEERLIKSGKIIPLYKEDSIQLEIKQISEVLRNYGLTLVKTANGYGVLKTGNMVAQNERI